MQRTVPILHIDGYQDARAYYVDWFGFKVDWEFRFEPTFPVYMQVSRGGVLHLSQHEGDNPSGVMCQAAQINMTRGLNWNGVAKEDGSFMQSQRNGKCHVISSVEPRRLKRKPHVAAQAP